MDDVMSKLESWYYVDSWKWVASTWGSSSTSGQWVKAGAKGPFYSNTWNANFATEWAASDMRMQGITKYLVRRFRYTSSGWVREV